MINYTQLSKEMEKAGTAKSLTPEFRKLDKKGDKLVGVLKSVEQVQSQRGDGHFNVYVFNTDQGLIKTKFGDATDKEVAASMEPGDLYSVEFIEQIKLPTGNPRNVFEVRLVATFEELEAMERPDAG